MMTKRVFFVVLAMVLAMPALAIVPFAGAQEGPPQVGLRPDAPPYALHGPYWVGTRDFVIDEGSEHPIPITVWYPALNPNNLPEDTEYQVTFKFFETEPATPPTVKGHALRDAEADLSGGPYPLILYSHGGNLFRAWQAYYTEHLASYGFVVIAPDHLGDTMDTWLLSVVKRLPELNRSIDYAEVLTGAGGVLEGMIDTDRVGVTGHSSGGTASLGTGGARVDWEFYKADCAEFLERVNPEDYECLHLDAAYEQQLLAAAGLDSMPAGLWPSLGDDRVKAVVPLAGNIAAYGPQGLKELTVPAMVVFLSGDTQALPVDHVSLIYDYAGSEDKIRITMQNADHFAVVNTCDTMPWLVDAGFGWICMDSVWDMDRAHDLINHFTTAFLLATLKNDTEAAAALAPDAVQFPGITYEAQGF